MDKEKKDPAPMEAIPLETMMLKLQICMPLIKQWQDPAQGLGDYGTLDGTEVYYWRQRCL